MKIKIVTIGSLKEKYLSECCKEYLKRISRFHSINIIELEEEKLPKNYSEADISKCLVREGVKIEKQLSGFVIMLDIKGNQLDSREFANKIDAISLNYDTITFVIGGSYGICEQTKLKANILLSFSKMTFPHQLARLIALEQIYRALSINAGSKYHK